MKNYVYIISALALLASNAVSARELDVSITNLTQGIYFTPLLVAAHNSDAHLFERGIIASANAFAMTRVGFSNVAIYTASLQEWAADPALPMVVEPSE